MVLISAHTSGRSGRGGKSERRGGNEENAGVSQDLGKKKETDSRDVKYPPLSRERNVAARAPLIEKNRSARESPS